MKKIILKLKDKWREGIFFFLITWLGNKFLDGLTSKINLGDFLNKIFSILDYKVSILSILVGIGSSIISYKIFQYFKIKQRGLKIIKAVYGVDNSWLNITNELNNAVIDNKLNIVLSNNISGDPIHGKQKIGNINYEYMGKQFETKYIEGQLIVLP